MNLLAIETSTPLASFALKVNGKIFTESRLDPKSANYILPIINELLQVGDVKVNQLDGIVVGRGPGSFTGIRVALAIAKGLAYGHNLPVYPVSSLLSISYQLSKKHDCSKGQILSLIDARMNEFYWTITQALLGSVEQVSRASLIEIANLCDNLYVGGIFPKSIVEELNLNIRTKIIALEELSPDALSMIELVEKGMCKSVDAATAMPVYIRNKVTHGD